MTGSQSSIFLDSLNNLVHHGFVLKHNDAGADVVATTADEKKKLNLKKKNTPDEYWIMTPFGENHLS